MSVLTYKNCSLWRLQLEDPNLLRLMQPSYLSVCLDGYPPKLDRPHFQHFRVLNLDSNLDENDYPLEP